MAGGGARHYSKLLGPFGWSEIKAKTVATLEYISMELVDMAETSHTSTACRPPAQAWLKSPIR